MKIKVRPYPNFKITEEAFQNDVISSSVSNIDLDVQKNQLIIVTEFNTGEKRVIKARPVKYQDKLFVTAFPNPVHLFLSVAIENYNHSEKIKELNFFKCGINVGNDILILDIEENGTHECYNQYIKFRASSIIMLVSSLEAYLNHVIPNDFIYKTVRNNKNFEFNKDDIESPKVSFKEKLIDIIPQWLRNKDFWAKNEKIKKDILNLYENRKNIIHLKTNSKDDFERYFPAIDKMLDVDILQAIKSTISFMNLTTNNFIEFDNDENTNSSTLPAS